MNRRSINYLEKFLEFRYRSPQVRLLFRRMRVTSFNEVGDRDKVKADFFKELNDVLESEYKTWNFLMSMVHIYYFPNSPIRIMGPTPIGESESPFIPQPFSSASDASLTALRISSLKPQGTGKAFDLALLITPGSVTVFYKMCEEQNGPPVACSQFIRIPPNIDNDTVTAYVTDGGTLHLYGHERGPNSLDDKETGDNGSLDLMFCPFSVKPSYEEFGRYPPNVNYIPPGLEGVVERPDYVPQLRAGSNFIRRIPNIVNSLIQRNTI